MIHVPKLILGFKTCVRGSRVKSFAGTIARKNDELQKQIDEIKQLLQPCNVMSSHFTELLISERRVINPSLTNLKCPEHTP